MTGHLRGAEPLRYCYVLHRGAHHEVGEAFGRLGRIVGPLGLFARGRGVGAYYGDPSTLAEDELFSHAGVTTDDDPPAGTEIAVIPGGPVFVRTHEGAYTGIGDAWKLAYTDFFAAGHLPDPSRPPHEVYLNDRDTTPEKDLRTEIRIPLLRVPGDEETFALLSDPEDAARTRRGLAQARAGNVVGHRLVDL